MDKKGFGEGNEMDDSWDGGMYAARARQNKKGGIQNPTQRKNEEWKGPSP